MIDLKREKEKDVFNILKDIGKEIIEVLVVFNFIGLVYVNLPVEWQVALKYRVWIYIFFDISIIVYIFEMALRISFNKNYFNTQDGEGVRNWMDFILLIISLIMALNYHFEGMGLRIVTLDRTKSVYKNIWKGFAYVFQIKIPGETKELEKFAYEDELRKFANSIIILNVISYILMNSESLMNGLIAPGFEIILAGINYASAFVFSIEMAIRVRYYKWTFFKSFWNCFDLIVTLISLIGMGYYFYARALNLSRFAKSFQMLRQLNLSKAIGVEGKMRDTTNAMIKALPSIGWIAIYFVFLFLIYGAVGRDLYGGTFEFSTLHQSFVTLFQIMTFDNWNIIMQHAMISRFDLPPILTYFYFYSFVIVASYILLNAVTGIIVHYVEDTTKGVEEKQLDKTLADIKTQLDNLQKKLDNIESKK